MVLNEYGVVEKLWNTDLERDGYDYALVVDTSKATYKGREWRELSNFDRRKLDNLIALSSPPNRIKVIFR